MCTKSQRSRFIIQNFLLAHPSLFIYFGLAASLLFFFPTLHAQQSRTFAEKGDVELGGSFSYRHDSDIFQGKESDTWNFLSFLPYAGYFITDDFEIGVNPLGIMSGWNSQFTTTYYQDFIAPAFNFKIEGNIYPFVELQLGYMVQKVSDNYSPTLSGLCWGVRSGVKLQFTGQGLRNLGIQY
jgi:hypothetical protein